MKDLVTDAGMLASTLLDLGGPSVVAARLNYMIAWSSPRTPKGDDELATALIAREMVQRGMREATAIKRNLTPSEALRTTKAHALEKVESGTLTVFDKVVSTMAYRSVQELVEEYPDGGGWGWADTDVYAN